MCQICTAFVPVLMEAKLISAAFGKAYSVYRLFRDGELTRLPHPISTELQIRKTVDHRACVLPYVIVT